MYPSHRDPSSLLTQSSQRIKDEQESLRVMEERNAQLERDVARYQERLRIEKQARSIPLQSTFVRVNIPQISILNVLIPVNEYHEAKERYAEAKERQRELHARVAELRDKNAPVHAKRE